MILELRWWMCEGDFFFLDAGAFYEKKKWIRYEWVVVIVSVCESENNNKGKKMKKEANEGG